MAKSFKKMIIAALMAALCVLTLCAPMAMAENDFFEEEGFFADDILDFKRMSLEDKYADSLEAEDDLVIILDEEVPLADVPATGDASVVWALMSFVSVGGLVLAGTKRRK